jgi:surface carbohydrate biosynthesis protein
MIFNRLKSAVKNFYQIFIAPPKQWKTPNEEMILIYDACGADILAPYLSEYGFEIISLRGESINIPCLMRAVLKLSFWKAGPIQAYADSYIELVSPKVVITFIDNNPAFYNISNRFSDIKTIFLQNGIRDEVADVFGKLVKAESYHVDHMLVYADGIGRHYQKFISGHIKAIGSFKNNHIKKSVETVASTILFISQYHDKPGNDEIFCIDNNGNKISWDQFFAVEVQVLSFLGMWCVENNKFLKICGRGSEQDILEKVFYDSCLRECKWEYIPRIDSQSSYCLVDSAEIVVFIDSTLGYESIGRGKKTASFSCRHNGHGAAFYNFGWPSDMPDNGPFWTNEADENQFRRIMDYLNRVNAEEWESVRQLFVRELMEFDPGNKGFISLLNQLLRD